MARLNASEEEEVLATDILMHEDTGLHLLTVLLLGCTVTVEGLTVKDIQVTGATQIALLGIIGAPQEAGLLQDTEAGEAGQGVVVRHEVQFPIEAEGKGLTAAAQCAAARPLKNLDLVGV